MVSKCISACLESKHLTAWNKLNWIVHCYVQKSKITAPTHLPQGFDSKNNKNTSHFFDQAARDNMRFFIVFNKHF